MDVETEIRNRVFNGYVPVLFIVEKCDVPLCLKVPRYIPLGLFTFQKFSEFIGVSCHDLWFSIDGKPIRWNLPIGVLYDTYITKEKYGDTLQIGVNMSNFPNDSNVLRCDSMNLVSFSFCQAIKESSFVMHQTTDFITNNQGIQQKILDSILENNFVEYQKLDNIRLGDKETQKYLPLKLIEKDGRIIQAFTEISTEQTLSDVCMDKELFIDSVIIQGIEISSEITLDKLIPLAFPDGFIYAVV